MDASKGPQAEVRDETGYVVPPERWTDEQRRQWSEAITRQFGEGEQLPTIEAFRNELAVRWLYADEWQHIRALREWTFRQLDGLVPEKQEPRTQENYQSREPEV